MSLLCSPHNMCATLFSNVFSVCKVNGPPPDASQLSPALKNIICFFENIFCFAIHHWIQGMYAFWAPTKDFLQRPKCENGDLRMRLREGWSGGRMWEERVIVQEGKS